MIEKFNANKKDFLKKIRPLINSPVICLTGQMAAGKNYVCAMLEKLGAVSTDLDKTAHIAIQESTQQILDEFQKDAEESGINLQTPDGSLNRRALGKLIFSEPSLLKKQEEIVYPKIIELTKKFIEENEGKTVILNATVLHKTPELMALCSKIIFVSAPCFKRLFRAKKRDGMPLNQLMARFSAQKNLLQEYKKTGKPIIIVKN
ncbi:dephospho-CoA kinase [Treponema zioleckii]|uniref:dephospho-CoA kinase n=1 Tax=Treponema zioleckii TaxID=331680 RepID=UPI00168AB252|nr:dephospho-CoA kinase [Treponema zioleckii]